jgi:hypothetical protein
VAAASGAAKGQKVVPGKKARVRSMGAVKGAARVQNAVGEKREARAQSVTPLASV